MARAKSVPKGDAAFFALSAHEDQFARGLKPEHVNYCCGACGETTHGRVVCSMVRSSGDEILWCRCSCEKQEPTVLIEDSNGVISQQAPLAIEFRADDSWPAELSQLYNEAARSLSAGANTACAMVCRKILMATACKEGDADGKRFVQYVDYITDEVLTYPRAKTSIDKIRNIGNEANHSISFVSPADARHSMKIVTFMLNAIYGLPSG